MKDDMSSPFLSHMVDDDFDEKSNKIKFYGPNLKCCVWKCKNSSDNGKCFVFGGLVLCAPCYAFLTTGRITNSQLERNGKDLIRNETIEKLREQLRELLK